MSMHGIKRLGRAARWLRNQLAPGGIVLLYHRVGESASDPFHLSVTPRHFAEHLEVLRKLGRPVSLQQFVRALQSGERPRRAVVVTFDDGYADNLHNARPLLERFDIPATVFVATGHIEDKREFWWDELDRLLLQPGTLPETLCIEAGGRIYEWNLSEAADYSEEAYLRGRDWNCYMPEADDPGPRQRLYRALHGVLRPLPPEERQRVIGQLLTWAGKGAAGRPTHRALSLNEVSDLVSDGLIEVGAHTVTHPVLSALPADAQEDEIRQSKIRLEQILNRPVNAFSYPFGGPSDYTAETMAAVRGAGFDCACSTLGEVVRHRADLFQLPRFTIQDCDGERFSRIVRRLGLG